LVGVVRQAYIAVESSILSAGPRMALGDSISGSPV
jgi:hypothetical protein